MGAWHRYSPAAALWLIWVTSTLAQVEPRGQGKTGELLDEYTLELDGKSVDVRAGEATTLEVGGKKVRAKVTAKPDKLFRGGGVSFRIPREYSLESDAEPDGTESWMLDGNNGVVHLARFRNAAAPKHVIRDTVEALTGQYGKANIKTSNASLNLGGRAHGGTRLNVQIVGQNLVQDVFAFEAGGVTFVLMVQETPQEDGSSEPELRRVRELLATTFRIDADRK